MYATVQDIIDRYGEEALLLLADRDGDGTVDQEVVDRARADAGALIDSYLATKYELPLTTMPPVLVPLAVDIIVYRLASEADVATEERRQRYDDALATLTRISKGAVSLGLADPPAQSPGGVMITSQPARFGRGKGL